MVKRTINVAGSLAPNARDWMSLPHRAFVKAADWFGIAAGIIKKDTGNTSTINSVHHFGHTESQGNGYMFLVVQLFIMVAAA